MTREQALQRAEELVESIKSYVMATVDADGNPHMRWMGALVRDPNDPTAGYILSGSTADKVKHIAANPATQLLFTAPEYECILTINGHCNLVSDQSTKKMVWDAVPVAEQYFSGPEGEDFGVLRFTACCLEVLCMKESHEPVRVEL